MKKTDKKAFLEALETFYSDSRKYKSFFKDKRITCHEKKILKAWELLKQNQFEGINELLLGNKSEMDEFTEAQTDLILGICANNRGEASTGEIKLFKAYKIIKTYSVRPHHFLCLYNLFMCQLNLKKLESMKKTLAKMNDFQPKSQEEATRFLLCQFSYNLFINNFEAAEDNLEALEGLSSNMESPVKVTYLILKYEYFIKLDLFEKAKLVVESLKEVRNFKTSANWLYMKKMLDHIIDKKPLYIYPNQFKDDQFLLLQISCIERLNSGDIDGAQAIWNKLSGQAPSLFAKDFSYQGDKCVFSEAVNMYKKDIKAKKELRKDSSAAPREMTKEESLVYLLKNASGSLSKEELYFGIWGKEWEDKNDLSKLKKLVSRVRKKLGISIIYEKECYRLIEDEKRAS